jgi:O-acetylhomoserine (thiol)-lyase
MGVQNFCFGILTLSIVLLKIIKRFEMRSMKGTGAKMDQDRKTYRLGTLALHAGQEADPTTMARAVPIYATTSYVFKSTEHAADLFALKEFGNIYSRLMNPTNDVLEKRLAALDGGVGGLAFASGQAAITAAILSITHSGQNFISSTSLYGGTWTLFSQTFKKLGIEVRFFDPDHPEQIAGLADDNTRLVYLESIGNPKNDVPDFQRISEISHRHGLPVIVDNTVLTPALFRPIEHGADIVIYSTTKFIGGHGVHVGGAIVDSGRFVWADNPAKWPEFTAPDEAYHGIVFTEALKPLGNVAYIIHIRTHWLRDTGACMSPFAAFLFLLGLETLHIRVERHVQNALSLARWLEKHPSVSWVNYPGLESHKHHSLAQRYLKNGAGAILGFGIRGGRNAGVRFINSVKLASHLANIGDAKTLVIHPASTTHSQLSEKEQKEAGVTQEYIRVSVGIEDFEDIREDFDQALTASQQ